MSRFVSFILIATLLLLYNLSVAQRIDTIYKAIATTNTYISLPFYGTTSNGHIWCAGLNNRYKENGAQLPIEMVRIDLTNNTVSYKILKGTVSSASVYWSYTFDSLGNFYLGLNTANRKIFRFNLKDSIWYENLGNGFTDNQALAYSLSLGLDNRIYFGSSSGGTFWSEYDPQAGVLTKHDRIDPNNDYVLTIMGDSTWVYAQVGQRNSIDMWAIRKKDEYKVKLFSIRNTTRFNPGIHRDGIFIQFNTDTLSGTFLLKDGKAIPATYKTPLIEYNELNTSTRQTIVTTYYDNTASGLFYSINNTVYKTIHINTSSTRNNIRFMFFDKKDTTGFGYVGDYYGNWYWYSYKTDSAYLFGNTGFNVYSGIQYNDSIFYFGNYPSGALLRWNKNQKWTLQKFNNGVSPGTKTPASNPRVVGYFKSETPAGFHHGKALDFNKNYIVCAGDVIRIGNTCSIGTYNSAKDSMYGYDFHKIDRLSVVSIAKYDKLFIMSTSSDKGGGAKLYFYDPEKNTMVDSLDFNFPSYGKLYVSGNELIGITQNFLYKVNLKTRRLIRKDTLSQPVHFSMLLADGRIAINTTASLPEDFSNFLVIPFSSCYEANNCLYAIVNGNTIVRVRDYGKISLIRLNK